VRQRDAEIVLFASENTIKKKKNYEQCNATCSLALFTNLHQRQFTFGIEKPMEMGFYGLVIYYRFTMECSYMLMFAFFFFLFFFLCVY
jgi:hypothetical protein